LTEEDQTDAYCRYCRRTRQPFSQIIAGYQYSGIIRYLIHGLKYHRQLQYARLLGQLLATKLQQVHHERKPDYLIPVPLPPRRLRQRGYNQALEIARPISRQLKIPLDWFHCRRILETPPQTGLQGSDRRYNVQGAFRMHRALDGATVAIIDDVVTTTATVAELATILRRAGASRVDVWTAARTPLPTSTDNQTTTAVTDLLLNP
jgi:ComF family protein